MLCFLFLFSFLNRWHPGPWSPCSVSCGLGIQTRELECVQELNAKLKMRVAPGACIEKPNIKRTGQCKKSPCISSNKEEHFYRAEINNSSAESSARWTTGPWESVNIPNYNHNHSNRLIFFQLYPNLINTN